MSSPKLKASLRYLAPRQALTPICKQEGLSKGETLQASRQALTRLISVGVRPVPGRIGPLRSFYCLDDILPHVLPAFNQIIFFVIYNNSLLLACLAARHATSLTKLLLALDACWTGMRGPGWFDIMADLGRDRVRQDQHPPGPATSAPSLSARLGQARRFTKSSGRLQQRPPHPFSAENTSSSIFLASPKSMRLFSL